MTPTERRVTEEQVAKFRAALSDGMRSLKMIEAGFDPVIIRAEEAGMRSMLAELEEKLRVNGQPSRHLP